MFISGNEGNMRDGILVPALEKEKKGPLNLEFS